MEADVLAALRARAAYFTGGHDRHGRWLIAVPVPGELQPWTIRNMELALQYLLSTLGASEADDETRDESAPGPGFVLLVDTQKCPARMARAMLRHVERIVDTTLSGAATRSAPAPDTDSSVAGQCSRLAIVAVRSDAFWDSKLVDNCAKTAGRRDEPITIPKSRLDKYFDIEQLPDELGGRQTFEHQRWLQMRVRIDEFQRAYEKVLNDLENVHVQLLEHKAVRAGDVAAAVQLCAANHLEVQRAIEAILANGNTLESDLIEHTTKSSSSAHGHTNTSDIALIEPDLIHYRDRINSHLNRIDLAQTGLEQAWREFQHSIESVQQLGQLEDRIASLTEWFLGAAEQLLAANTRIGCDITSSESLRRDHEQLELKCSEPLGAYAELLHSIKNFPLQPDTFAHKDLMSRKEFMDFVCRSFATRMDRRRSVLITCSRFYRLVSEYFDRTNEVFETLVLGEKVQDFAVAAANLKTLADSEVKLDKIMRDLEKEGEKLSDILAMPIKDALGRDSGCDYSDDIATIREILDATLARRSIFLGSVDLQKLTLEQITHIHAYEMDAIVAFHWIGELFAVMCKTHLHVGCNVFEIQTQKDDLQTFQDTAKGTFNYGCQLLSAALSLRYSCKLSVTSNQRWLQRMNAAWNRLHTVSQEQMTRLRVSAVFYRSIDEYCDQLLDLRRSVANLVAGGAEGGGGGGATNTDEQRQSMRRHLVRRERLLVDVGRMVRLGRLLKTRLREPFDVPEDGGPAADGSMADANPVTDAAAAAAAPASSCVLPSAFAASSNAIACEAIGAKLTEVTRIAESLDCILRDLQHALDEASTDGPDGAAAGDPRKPGSLDNGSSRSAATTSNGHSTEDELFVTASEGTATGHSRSSSYRTASDGGGSRSSPWWSSPDQSAAASATTTTTSAAAATANFRTHSANYHQLNLNLQHHHFDADSSDADAGEVPTMQLLSGVARIAEPQAAEAEAGDSLDGASDLSGGGSTGPSAPPPPQPPPLPIRECVSAAAAVGAQLCGAVDKVSSGNDARRRDALTWSSYYGAVLAAKQSLKGCL